MDNRIRKISIAKNYISEDKIMNYVVGNHAYGDYKVVAIEEHEDRSVIIYAKNTNDEIIEWKKFNSSVPMVIEFSMDYDEEFDI